MKAAVNAKGERSHSVCVCLFECRVSVCMNVGDCVRVCMHVHVVSAYACVCPCCVSLCVLCVSLSVYV